MYYDEDSVMKNKSMMNIIATWLKTTDLYRATLNPKLVVGYGRALNNLNTLNKMMNYKTIDGFQFTGITPIEQCPVTERFCATDEGNITVETGSLIYNFSNVENSNLDFKVIGLCSSYGDMQGDNWTWYLSFVAAVPEAYLKTWEYFTDECARINDAVEPEEKVYVIGGKIESFVPIVDWDEIILPNILKHEIQTYVADFFNKGIDIYKGLNLKPFRKFLLAGPPGTGKTMICTAIAKWAISQNYIVIYISSAQKGQGDRYGSTFDKMEYALQIAAGSKYPTIILMEEIDAYLHTDEKALILNVLDGNESPMNSHGTLLIATTNYPDAIDERVMKRPGRLDRIFVIPEIKEEIDSEKMLRQYLGSKWSDDHLPMVKRLVGYSGAFIRELAIASLIRCASDDIPAITLELLESEFKALKDQIEARDSFLNGRPEFNGLNNQKDVAEIRRDRVAIEKAYPSPSKPGVKPGLPGIVKR